MPETWPLGQGEARARVAVVGCGGAGCNTLRRVAVPPAVDRVAVNDAPHPSMAGIPRRILVAPEPLRDIATLHEKTVPTMATDVERDLSAALLDKDVVLILGGLGGNLGGWSMGVVARVVRILGHTSLALATVPFTAEGMIRHQTAEAQLAALRDRADGVVAFGNDELLRTFPDLPLTKAFAALAAIMSRPAAGLASALSSADAVPLKRMLARAKEWRFGMGAGAERHRCFLAMEEAYHSPWFTGRHEDIREAVLLIRQPSGASLQDELLREVHLRSPLADIAWAVLPEPAAEDRVEVQVLAGVDRRF